MNPFLELSDLYKIDFFEVLSSFRFLILKFDPFPIDKAADAWSM